MRMYELLKKINKYNKQELFLKEHRDIRSDPEKINKFNKSLDKAEADNMLVPIIKNPVSDEPSFFPASFFFNSDSQFKFKMTQHTRYSTPVLHQHDFFEFFYVLEGEFMQHINQQDINMVTGDVCLIQPGVYHSLNVDNHSIVINVLIDTELFRKIFFDETIGNGTFGNFFKGDFQSNQLSTYVIFKTNGDEAIRQIFLQMYLEFINHEELFEQAIHADLLLFFSILLRQYRTSAIIPIPSKSQKNIDVQILNIIQTQYQRVTLTDLAQKFHYSSQYVSRRIKRVTGLSFNQYLLSRRMQVATDLLRNSTTRVHLVARTVGFNNDENFIRAFRKKFNMTPLQYRNTHHQ